MPRFQDLENNGEEYDDKATIYDDWLGSDGMLCRFRRAGQTEHFAHYGG
jgi:hypothetical protein